MFRETKDLELLGDGCLDDIFQRVFGMAWAELARMAVVREGHAVGVVCCLREEMLVLSSGVKTEMACGAFIARCIYIAQHLSYILHCSHISYIAYIDTYISTCMQMTFSLILY